MPPTPERDKKVSRPAIDRLARDIADDLFTNGTGERATRLVLMLEDPGNPRFELGGWGIAAMAHRISTHLQQRVSALQSRKRRSTR